MGHSKELHDEQGQERPEQGKDASTRVFLTLDQSLLVTWVSAGVAELTGTGPTRAKNLTLGAVLRMGGADEEVINRLEQAASRTEGVRCDVMIRGAASAPRWFELDMQPQVDDAGRLSGFIIVLSDNAEGHKLRETVRQREEEIALALMAARACIWQWNLETNDVAGAESIWRLLEQSPATTNVTSHALFDTVHPDDLARVRQSIEAHLGKHTASFHSEFRALTGARTWMWLNCVGQVTQWDGAGKPLCISGVLMKVDEQHAAAERLSESESRFEVMADSAPVLLWTAGLDRGCFFFNKTWLEFTGRTLEQEQGDGWAAGVHPEDVQRCFAIYARSFDARTPFEMEYRLQRHDGQYRWIIDRGVPRFGESGLFLGFIGSCMDIDDHRTAARAAAERLERLEESERLSHLGHWSWDVHSGRVDWSREVFRLFEMDPVAGEPDFQRMLATYEANSAHRLSEAIDEALKQRKSYDLTLRRSGPGEHWLHETGHPRTDPLGAVTGLFGTVMDVTERVLNERRLIEALAAAQTASRSKSEFLANMSHEIRTPLTAIMGYADVLMEDGDLTRAPQPRIEALETILRNGQHLLTLINDILDLSKIEAGKMIIESIAVDPAQIIEEVVSLLRVRAAGKNLLLTSRYDTPIPLSIASDPVRLRQILMNLAGNAVKFTETGTVQIVASVAGTEQTPSLRIAIVDTGIGIEAEHVGRLFEAFTQADTSTTRRFGGTGLGLQISARLATALNATITATSAPGAGSVFTLSMPISREAAANVRTPGEDELSGSERLAGRGAAAEPAAQSIEQPAAPLLGLRILLAEDGPDNQRLICHHLRRGGAEVTVVGNGKLALEALTQGENGDPAAMVPVPFDVVLMDMQMPVMDGYAAARAIKSAGCTVPVIALTAHAMSGEREKCMAAGCDDYTTKPIHKEELISKCSRWARGEMSTE